ncbi:uncharacterized protein LOC144458616 [Epinephelus lanceolatus]
MQLGDGIELVNGAVGGGYTAAKDIAKALPTHRQCEVHITNECASYSLRNPSVHIKSGRCLIPFPPTIQPSATGEAKFAKIPKKACGSVGIFTFDLFNNATKQCTEKIAVMYKVPFNLKAKSNAYAVGVFDINTECNNELFFEMSKKTNTTFVRGLAKGPSLTHKGDTVTIAATMSDCHTPYMKVEVREN